MIDKSWPGASKELTSCTDGGKTSHINFIEK